MTLNAPSAQAAHRSAPFAAVGAGAAGGAGTRRGPRAPAATTPIRAGEARRAEGRPQRSVPVRQRQEIQEVPWGQT